MSCFRASVLALCAALLVTACGDDDGAPPTPADVSIESFCTSYVDAVCARAARCSCVGTTPDLASECQTDATNECAAILNEPLVTAVAEGRAHYDATAAGRFIATVRDASCDLASFEASFRVRDVFTLGGVFDGTVEPGAPCTVPIDKGPSDCHVGMCPISPTPVCFGLSAQGQPCDPDPASPSVYRLCAPLDAPLVELASPERALRCVGGVCQPLADIGSPCFANGDCKSGRCDGDVCAETLPDGGSCVMDVECTSTNCDFGTGRCRPLETDGTLCSAHTECASGWCSGLGKAAGVCAAAKATGESCALDLECATGACVVAQCEEAACEVLE